MVPILPLLMFLALLLTFAWWMDKDGKPPAIYTNDKGRRAVSFLVGAVVIIGLFHALFPLGGISGGGLLIATAVA